MPGFGPWLRDCASRFLALLAMNPVERLAAAAHVGYQLRQMAGAAIRIDNAPDEATHDSHLESTVLHARNLIEFLIGAHRSRPDYRRTSAGLRPPVGDG